MGKLSDSVLAELGCKPRWTGSQVCVFQSQLLPSLCSNQRNSEVPGKGQELKTGVLRQRVKPAVRREDAEQVGVRDN